MLGHSRDTYFDKLGALEYPNETRNCYETKRVCPCRRKKLATWEFRRGKLIPVANR